MRLLRSAVILASLSLCATDLSAQTRGNFENSWFWGAKAGLNTFNTNAAGSHSVPTWGLDWLITRKQGGLYVSADQSFFEQTVTAADANSPNGSRRIKINDMRRVDFAGVVFPKTFGPVRPYAGVGAALLLLGSAVAQPDSLGGLPGPAFNDQTDKASSRSSLLFMAGVQLQKKRTAFFVQETMLPSAGDFLIRSVLSYFEVGVRYNFGSSIEGSR